MGGREARERAAPGLHDADELPVGDGDGHDERPGDDAAGDHCGDDVLEGHAARGEDVEEHDAFIGEEVLIEPVLEGVEQGQGGDAHLDAEFAMILYDSRKKWLIAARDPIGIRPLFYGYSKSGHIAFASEAKNLIGLCKKIYPFPIGSYYCNGKFVRYCDIADTPAYNTDDMDTTQPKIREKLVAGVDKRLDADTPVGFLLSGGLDSSLVCAIAAKKLGKPIRTFAIGMSEDAIDLKYA